MQEVRYKGLRKEDGKIIKGTMTEAPLKLKASSIPAKNETVVYSNHHKVAFGNSQERFYIPMNQRENVTPGPDNYKLKLNSSKVDSKKGSGCFASQTQLNRFDLKRNWNPGPGRYETPKRMNKTKSTVLLSSQLQRQQLFKSEIEVAKKLPGPGNYDRRLVRAFSTTTPNVFKSKTPRITHKVSQNPPLGLYRWQDSKKRIFALKFSKHGSPQKHRGQQIHSKYVDLLMEKDATTRTQSMVGPGKYDPLALITRRTFSIKQTNRDRFGEVKFSQADTTQTTVIAQPPPIVRDPILPSKKIPDHESAFKSKVRRYEFGQEQSKRTGEPAKYSPERTGKNSHHINFTNRWV